MVHDCCEVACEVVGLLYGLKVETLPLVKWRSVGLTLRKLLIDHPQVGAGISAAGPSKRTMLFDTTKGRWCTTK